MEFFLGLFSDFVEFMLKLGVGVVRGHDSGDELSDKSVRKEVLFWFSGFKFRVMGLTVGSGVLGRVGGSRLSSLEAVAAKDGLLLEFRSWRPLSRGVVN